MITLPLQFILMSWVQSLKSTNCASAISNHGETKDIRGHMLLSICMFQVDLNYFLKLQSSINYQIPCCIFWVESSLMWSQLQMARMIDKWHSPTSVMFLRITIFFCEWRAEVVESWSVNWLSLLELEQFLFLWHPLLLWTQQKIKTSWYSCQLNSVKQLELFWVPLNFFILTTRK